MSRFPFPGHSWRLRGQALRLQHLTDEQLLQVADGELNASIASEASDHLRSCWICRTRLEEYEEAIASVVVYRHHGLTACPPARPGARDRYIAALKSAARKHATGLEKPAVPARTWVGHVAWAPAGLVALALVAAAATLLWRVSPQSLSASDVIRRADDALGTMVEPGQVLHRRWAATFTVRVAGEAPAEYRREYKEWVQVTPRRLAVRAYLPNGRLQSASWTVPDGTSVRRWLYSSGTGLMLAKAERAPLLLAWPSDGDLARESVRYSSATQRAVDLDLSAETITPERLLERGFRRISDRADARGTAVPVRLANGRHGYRVEVHVPNYPMFGLRDNGIDAVRTDWTATLAVDEDDYLVRWCVIDVRLPNGDTVSARFDMIRWEKVSASAVEDLFSFEPPPGTTTIRLQASDVLTAAERVLDGTGTPAPAASGVGSRRRTH
jgi:hypothetical protein